MEKDVHIFLTLPRSGDPRCLKLLARLSPYSDMVTNLGFVPRAEVPGLYRAADALFLPTLSETLGLPYLEAMATGTPILTSDLEFARWCCQDFGIYFDPLDPVSIADAIRRFLDQGPPPNYRERARNRLKEFSTNWDQVARAYLQILDDAARLGRLN